LSAFAAEDKSEVGGERRRRGRRPMQALAWADPGGILPVIDCKIVDVSEGGARILAPLGVDVPDLFQLQIDSSRILGAAEVVWRGPRHIGVKFLTRI
jgi:hypothetical protein